MQWLCRDGCCDTGGAAKVLVEHSRRLWIMRNDISMNKVCVSELVQEEKNMALWTWMRKDDEYCYDVCELGEQAWLNEFQGDSFRIFSAPHHWNENATLILDCLNQDKLVNCKKDGFVSNFKLQN